MVSYLLQAARAASWVDVSAFLVAVPGAMANIACTSPARVSQHHKQSSRAQSCHLPELTVVNSPHGPPGCCDTTLELMLMIDRLHGTAEAGTDVRLSTTRLRTMKSPSVSKPLELEV